MIVNIPKITYVIPYRHTPDRLNTLRRVLEWLQPFQGLDVLIIEQDAQSKISELNFKAKHMFIKNNGPFNKAWAYNVAAKYVSTPIIIFGDSDLIMDPQEFINAVQMLDKYDFVNPYNSVIDLSPQESQFDINSILQINRIGRGEAENDIEKVPMCGGICMFNTEKFFEIGGSNEDFRAWGGEDDFLSLKVKMFLNHITITNKCYHFYHEKAPVNMQLYQRNLQILNHFANVSKEQMQTHINMVLPKIGRLNAFE